MAAADQLEQQGRQLSALAQQRRAWAGQLRSEADRMAPLLNVVASELTPAVWTGPAATRAHGVLGQQRDALSSSVRQLRDLADQLDAEANRLDQRASDAFDAAQRAAAAA